jgi:hypothetical protein
VCIMVCELETSKRDGLGPSCVIAPEIKKFKYMYKTTNLPACLLVWHLITDIRG